MELDAPGLSDTEGGREFRGLIIRGGDDDPGFAGCANKGVGVVGRKGGVHHILEEGFIRADRDHIIPSHLGNDGGFESGHPASHKPNPGAVSFLTPFHEELHAEADPKTGQAVIQGLSDSGLLTCQCFDRSSKGAHAGEDEAIPAEGYIPIPRDFNPRTAGLETLHEGVKVAGTIIQKGKMRRHESCVW
jgi:hypothetical protein